MSFKFRFMGLGYADPYGMDSLVDGSSFKSSPSYTISNRSFPCTGAPHSLFLHDSDLGDVTYYKVDCVWHFTCAVRECYGVDHNRSKLFRPYPDNDITIEYKGIFSNSPGSGCVIPGKVSGNCVSFNFKDYVPCYKRDSSGELVLDSDSPPILVEKFQYLGSVNVSGNVSISNSLETPVCNGIDLSELGYVNIDIFKGDLVLEGKNLFNQNVSDILKIEFTDEDMANGYKDIWLPRFYGNLESIKFRQPSNQLLGNGVFTVRSKYVSALSITSTALSAVANAYSGSVLGVSYDLFKLGLEIVPFDVPRLSEFANLFVGTVEPCSEYADVVDGSIPDVDCNFIEAIGDELAKYDFTRFLYPMIRLVINAGFEPMTDEDWCCDVIDSQPKGVGGGIYRFIGTGPQPEEPEQPEPEQPEPEQPEPEQPEPEQPEPPSDNCICDWLEKIDTTLSNRLESIELAISKLELSVKVEPSEPVDFSGVIRAINNLNYCGDESIACIIKNAFNRIKDGSSKSVTEVIEDSLNRDCRNVVDAIDELDDLTHTEVVVTPADNVYIRKVDYLDEE